jgi:hypothetical protein
MKTEEKMAEVRYVVQVKMIHLRQVEFTDVSGLRPEFVKENAESVAVVEFGDCDEFEVMDYEEQP